MHKARLEEISYAPQAHKGEKPRMNALIPSTESLVDAQSGEIPVMLSAETDAAEKGAESTRKMRSTFGRADDLGDRSIGPMDAGSASMSALFKAFATAIRQETQMTKKGVAGWPPPFFCPHGRQARSEGPFSRRERMIPRLGRTDMRRQRKRANAVPCAISPQGITRVKGSPAFIEYWVQPEKDQP